MLLDLPGRGLRDLREDHGARDLEARQQPPAVLDQLGLRRRRPGLQLHVGAGRLAPLLVGLCDDPGEGDRGVAVERLLDLDRRDVLAAGDDDVLGPILDLHVAVRFPDRQVPGVEPPAGERLLGGLGVLEVPHHRDVAAEDDLADGLAVRRHLVARRAGRSRSSRPRAGSARPAGRCAGRGSRRPAPPRRRAWRRRRRARSLGQPVDVGEVDPEPFGALEGAGRRGRGRDHRVELVVERRPQFGAGRRGAGCGRRARRSSGSRGARRPAGRSSPRPPLRRQTFVPAFAAIVQGKHQPLQWNIGSVHR